MSGGLCERLRERVVIGYHDDGYASIGTDKDGKTTYDSRPSTPMTRPANRDGAEAAALIEELVAALQPLHDAANGLSHGVDWNNGTHAKTHGYRRKLLKAIPAADAVLAKARGEQS